MEGADFASVDELIKRFNSSPNQSPNQSPNKSTDSTGSTGSKKLVNGFKKRLNSPNKNPSNLDRSLNSSSGEKNDQNHVLYVLVVGFHHKKGCQIDYCYPPMKGDDFKNEEQNLDESPTNRLPSIWKTLPSIALPDGAHNFDRDTIYFHLPNPKNTQKTIFGISCYRQIAAEKLKEKDEEVTRGTVQKSVVVLSELPLYGLIAVKCEMITTLYFKECDFSKTNCLKELYTNLNSILTKDLLTTSEVFFGLSPRDLILLFSHKIIILFKLILLEKKVLFYKSPVKDLCTSILTLLSLFPGLIEEGGLDYSSTNVRQKKDKDRKFSSDIELIQEDESEEELIITQSDDKLNSSIMLLDETTGNNISAFYSSNRISTGGNQSASSKKSKDTESTNSDKDESNESNDNVQIAVEAKEEVPFLKYRDDDVIDPKQFYLGDEMHTPLLFKLSLKDCGFPLNIFRRSSYCHPYLSLAYLDILSDQRVKSFVIGATNYLFKQKRNLFDVIVELDGAKIDIIDNDLKKRLQLSTEDLRFADYLVKCIEENAAKGETKLFDNTNFEGGDEWLRYQFKIYLIQLLITSKSSESSKEYHSFNSLFMNAWKETVNYKTWSNLNLNAFETISPGHPFYGQLSIADMKLRFNHAINNTERVKKINQTVQQAGKALNSAKTAVYSWWTTLGTPKNVNNLDIDKNTSTTASDLNLSSSSSRNEQDSSSVTRSINSTISGLKISNSFTSFTLSSLINASEDAMNKSKDKNESNKIESI